MRITLRFALDVLRYVGIVVGGVTLFLVLAPVFGYLPYSDRPGPGWFGSFPAIGWREFRLRAGGRPGPPGARRRRRSSVAALGPGHRKGSALNPAEKRFAERVRAWGLTVQRSGRTESSLVACGWRGEVPVFLKVVRRPGDEWRSGDVLRAFGGHGVVRVLDHVEGAVLMEWLQPGTPLVRMALHGRDDEATSILADVIRRMGEAPASTEGFPTVRDWGEGFRRYRESGDARVPRGLAELAEETYRELCETQGEARMLHGDLQHYNVLYDDDRGWGAIDPKGVVGEVAYEVGAMLRNPVERPELFASPQTVERRLGRLAAVLGIDPERALAWGFAQAVLSAIWSVEDGEPVDATHPSLLLANAIRPGA